MPDEPKRWPIRAEEMRREYIGLALRHKKIGRDIQLLTVQLHEAIRNREYARAAKLNKQIHQLGREVVEIGEKQQCLMIEAHRT